MGRKPGKHRFRKHTGVRLELKAMWAEKQRRLLPTGSSDDTGPGGPLQRPRVCLLCSSFCFLVKPKVNSQLVEKLFCIPVEEFQTKYSSLEKPYLSYINFCRNCISFVQDYDGIYEEWKRINEKIREIENQLEEKIQQSQPLLKDIFKENTILCQLYEDIRSNFCPVNSSQQPFSTINTASFLNLGMGVPSFDFENVENISITPEETTELKTEVKVEAIIEDEEPDWDGGVIESMSGNDRLMTGMTNENCGGDSEELQLNSESPNLLTSLISHLLPDVDAKVDDDVESSSLKYDGSSSSSSSSSNKISRKRKRSRKKKSGKRTQKRSLSPSSTSKKFCTKWSFKCLLCEEEFMNKKAVTVHIESEHGKKSKFIRKTVRENETCRTNVSEYGGTPTSLSCPEAKCSKIYETDIGLRMHRISVHNYPSITFNCEFCSYQTKIKNWLKQHRLLHTGEKPYVCYFCGATFRKRERVTNHIRQHTLERPYFCNICHKDFTSADKVRRHKQIHTEERLFLCSICGKKSKTANNLYIHMWSHDPSQKHRYSNSKSKRMKKSTDTAAADKTNDDVPPESTTAASVVQQNEIAKSNTVSSSTIFNMDSQKVIIVDTGAENFQQPELDTSEAYSLFSSNPLHNPLL